MVLFENSMVWLRGYMKVERLIVGDLEENCYILTKNNKTLIIDPGDESTKIINFCKNKNVIGVLVTHHHFDHIGALNEICKYFNVCEVEMAEGFDFEVIKNPGHSSDSKSYYFKGEKIMFCGDFIFFNSIGRMDLPGGNVKDMMSSLTMICKYPDDIILYPGHGPSTLLGHEKNNFKYYF